MSEDMSTRDSEETQKDLCPLNRLKAQRVQRRQSMKPD